MLWLQQDVLIICVLILKKNWLKITFKTKNQFSVGSGIQYTKLYGDHSNVQRL